jgi:hypothetical protein
MLPTSTCTRSELIHQTNRARGATGRIVQDRHALGEALEGEVLEISLPIRGGTRRRLHAQRHRTWQMQALFLQRRQGTLTQMALACRPREDHLSASS